jgi:hypothetical protein
LTVNNTIHLGIIFNKSNGVYTDDALLYQKILSFPLTGTNQQFFTNWEMCKWLQKHHKRFEKRSPERLQGLVERKIEKLIELQLVHKIGTQPISTGTGQTPVYIFDPTSYLLGWLIESLSSDPVRRSQDINKVYDIFWLMLDTDAPSPMKIFLKSLVKKTKESGFFSQLVNHMIEVLESGNSIKDISDLINQTLLLRYSDLNLVNKYNELWGKTLNELESKKKQLVMFRIKLYYEQRMKDRAYNLAQFELARYDAKEKFDKIVLECGCLFCLCVTYEAIDLIEYTIRLRYHIEGIPALEKDCPSCKKTRSLQIIDL